MAGGPVGACGARAGGRGSAGTPGRRAGWVAAGPAATTPGTEPEAAECRGSVVGGVVEHGWPVRRRPRRARADAVGVAGLRSRSECPARATFRLSDATEDAQWRLEFLLQSIEDPSLLVPAEQAWNAGEGLRRWLDRPQELLLGELGRASRVYPELELALRQARPVALELDADGATGGLGEAPRLERLARNWSQTDAVRAVRTFAAVPLYQRDSLFGVAHEACYTTPRSVTTLHHRRDAVAMVGSGGSSKIDGGARIRALRTVSGTLILTIS